MKNSMTFITKLKIKVSYDVAIPLLGIYISKTLQRENFKRHLHTHIHCSMKACNSWKQPK